MGEVYHLFGQDTPTPESKEKSQDGSADVVSYDTFLSRRSKKHRIPFLDLQIIDQTVSNPVEAISSEPDNIFLPNSRQHIIDDNYYTIHCLKKTFPDANFFPTVTAAVYDLHRDIQPDYAQQMVDGYRANFQRLRIANIIDLFISEGSHNMFVGTLEEVVHLTRAIDERTASGRKGNLDSFMLLPREPSKEEQDFRTYINGVEEGLEKIPRIVPRRKAWFRKNIRLSDANNDYLDELRRMWKKTWLPMTVEEIEKEFGPL